MILLTQAWLFYPVKSYATYLHSNSDHPHHHGHGAPVYVQPSRQTHTVIVDVKPSSYLVLSIITMIFFCWIFGLIALLNSVQVTMQGRACNVAIASLTATIIKSPCIIVCVYVHVHKIGFQNSGPTRTHAQS